MNADTYTRQVEAALRDLPWSQRRDLVAELRGHLADFPAGTDLEARLGTPEQYAADLRAAEGLERRRGLLGFLRARRPRNVVLVVVALILAGLIAGGIAWVQSYQPLHYDFGGLLPTQLKQAPNGAYKPLVFEKGGHFRFGVPITNNGTFGVRILGLGGIKAGPIALMPDPPLPFTVKLMMTRPLPVATWDNQRGPLTPFHPFDLPAGQTAMLVLEATYTKSCRPWGPGEVATLEPSGFYLWDGSLPVRFHFLWKTSTALIFPQFLLQVRFPKGCL